MRVLFFISNLGHGRGGHFNSLNHIASSFSSEHQVGIVPIGPGYSSIISNHSSFLSQIDFNGIKLIKLKGEINNVINEFDPDVIHCFDTGSYNVVRLFYNSSKIKLVLNKCGGPNPVSTIRYPYVKNLILFSAENKEWFGKKNKYSNSNITLIPNRVSKIITTPLDIIKPEGFFSFVRIARIGKAYKKSIFNSIALIDILYIRNKNLKIKLFIIGVVECQDTLSEILKNKHVINGTVIVITDDKYTNNASKMLYLADAVIGTGRGVMESTSLGLPTLTINSLGDLPVLITNELFDDAFKTNFSERNIFPLLTDKKNINDIEKLIVNKDFYQELSLYMRFVFKENFDIKQASYKYECFYNSIIDNGGKSFLPDSLVILKTLLNFYRKSKLININKKI